MLRKLGINKLICIALSVYILTACDNEGGHQNGNAVSHHTDINWTSYGGDSSENHYSSADQINDSNISDLRLAWSYDLPVTMNGMGTPLAIDGIIYAPVGHSYIYALNAQTGALIWEYDPKVFDHAGAEMRAGWPVRGIAYANGKVYTGTLDGRLISIDAKTGSEVWSVQTIDREELLDVEDGRFIAGPPFIMGNKVVIGNGGADRGPTRGYVTAYDLETGKKQWRFYTVPGNPADGFENDAMAMATRTWTGEWWQFGGGGTVWNAMAYDEELNRLYIGTGNGFPWNQKIRSSGGGDNLFLCAIVALDADTGEYIWHYQYNPGETWDYNAAMDIELADLSIDGKRRKVILQAPKNGFFYVIDRETGALISAEKFAKTVTWADHIDRKTGRPVEHPDARFPGNKAFLGFPSPMGAHGIAAMAFNQNSGLVYIPVIESGAYFTNPADIKNWKLSKIVSNHNFGLGVPPTGIMSPSESTGALLAWDPALQKERWRLDLSAAQNGGILTTAGNLVFQGKANGTFNAYAADTGQKLWSFDVQNGVGAPPISYVYKGKQYITVLSGWRSHHSNGMEYEWDYYSQKRRVLTFVLGGTARLPEKEEVSTSIFEAPDFIVNQSAAHEGSMIYNNANCAMCHGGAAVSKGTAPDLRKSPVPADFESMKAVLHEEILRSNGMPSFPELTDQNIRDLQHYIRREAQAALMRTGMDAAQNGATCDSTGEIGFICGPQNPEDIIQIGDTKWLITSGMGGRDTDFANDGRLYLVDHQKKTHEAWFPGADSGVALDQVQFPNCPGPIDTKNFSAHGLAIQKQSLGLYRLYVTGHGAREAIEVFEVRHPHNKPVIAWIGCVPLPSIMRSNAVAILPDGGFVTTKFYDTTVFPSAFVPAFRQKLRAGEPTGAVYEWHPGAEVTRIAETALSGPNGIAVSPDGRWMYVVAMATREIVRFDRKVRPMARESVRLDITPDNLHWGPDNRLYTVGKNFASLDECSAAPCETGWSVIEIEPEKLTARRIFRADKATALQNVVTSAIRVGDAIWLGAYRGNRIGYLSLPQE